MVCLWKFFLLFCVIKNEKIPTKMVFTYIKVIRLSSLICQVLMKWLLINQSEDGLEHSMSVDWDQRRRFESPRDQMVFSMIHDKIFLYIYN